MRIAVLSCLLLFLLWPNLRSAAATPTIVWLNPTPNYPQAAGTARLTQHDNQLLLTFDLHHLPAGDRLTQPIYVVWLVTGGRLRNVGALVVNAAGDAGGTVGPVTLGSEQGILAISAEEYANVAQPAMSGAIILAGQMTAPPATPGGFAAFTREFGPDWFAPLMPAALGFALLRQAGRARGAARQVAALTAGDRSGQQG
jgi:hypothetical protein